MGPEMSDRHPIDRALDAFVYAPLGLVLTALDHLPRLAEEGRRRFDGQARLARMVGEMAVAQGRRQVATLLGSRPGAAAGPEGRASQEAGPDHDPQADRTSEGPGPSTDDPGDPAAPGADELAIPGYDSLSASQVVQRLAGLSADELEGIRRYEQAGRGRKTILHRVAQLRN